jgi:hypothetical protein
MKIKDKHYLTTQHTIRFDIGAKSKPNHSSLLLSIVPVEISRILLVRYGTNREPGQE